MREIRVGDHVRRRRARAFWLGYVEFRVRRIEMSHGVTFAYAEGNDGWVLDTLEIYAPWDQYHGLKVELCGTSG